MAFLVSRPAVIISCGTALTCSMFLYKDYVSGPKYEGDTQADGKVVIVTGANTGIGKMVALEMALRGAKVYMACRDLFKCENARKDIVLASTNKYVYCRQCDLSSFESIRNFVEQFKSEQDRLDILINNAGVSRCPKSITRDGIELQLGVNHMGHFLLTNLLVDHLIKSAPSRVVVVASVAHKRGTIDKDDLNMDKDYEPSKAYSRSKLANVLFANELSRRLLDKNVTVNCVHPGIVDTEIYRHMPVVSSFTRYILYPFAWPFLKDPRGGAQTILYAAIDPELKNVTGKYFKDLKSVPVSKDAEDVFLARWLWKASAQWAKIETIL